MKTAYLLQSQVDLIFAALMPGNRLVLQVMLRCGLRISDALALRQEQLARCFWITEQKTKKRRQCGLPDWLIAEIKREAGNSPWAFPSPRDSSKHRTRQAVWKDLKRVALAFRVPVNVGTHSMRKCYAVDLLEKYGDIEMVRRALNHSDLSVTMIYAMADKLVQTLPARHDVKRRRK